MLEFNVWCVRFVFFIDFMVGGGLFFVVFRVIGVISGRDWIWVVWWDNLEFWVDLL